MQTHFLIFTLINLPIAFDLHCALVSLSVFPICKLLSIYNICVNIMFILNMENVIFNVF